MIPGEQKIERMVKIARMYYEQDMTQSQIAKELNISRPLVSILLTEAKECGIVKISINDINTNTDKLAKHLKERFSLTDVILVPDESNNDATNMSVSDVALTYCFSAHNMEKKVGIGWGSMIGHMADIAENMSEDKRNTGEIFPLTGGISSVIRGYHTNEMVRIFALKSGKTADFLYVPALFDTNSELEIVKQTEPYVNIQNKWNEMDQAIISISNYPSYPDMGVKTLYGDKLTEGHAVGRILAHYFDKFGNVINPNEDSVLQASIEQLKDVEVIAVCSNQIKPVGVVGALRLGVISSLIIPMSLAQKVAEYKD